MKKMVILSSILFLFFLIAWMKDSIIHKSSEVERGCADIDDFPICMWDHLQKSSEPGIPDPRGPIIAGIKMFSNLINKADEFEVPERDLVEIRKLANDYEKEANKLFLELSKTLYPLHVYTLTLDEIDEIRENARIIADELDDLYLDTYFKALPYLTSPGVLKYKEWFKSMHPLHQEELFSPEELKELDQKYSKP